MLPMMLAQQILNLSEYDLLEVLRKIETEDRELYQLLVEKISEL